MVSFFTNDSKEHKKYWICIINEMTNCKARMTIIENLMKNSCGDHNHFPPIEKTNAKNVMVKIIK